MPITDLKHLKFVRNFGIGYFRGTLIQAFPNVLLSLPFAT